MKCQQLNANGDPCKRKATEGVLCWQHAKEKREAVKVSPKVEEVAEQALREEHVRAPDSTILQIVEQLLPALKREMNDILIPTAEEMGKLRQHFAEQDRRQREYESYVNKRLEEIQNRSDAVSPEEKARAKAKAASDVAKVANAVRANQLNDSVQQQVNKLKNEERLPYVPVEDQNFTFLGFLPVNMKKGQRYEVPESLHKELMSRESGLEEFKERAAVLEQYLPADLVNAKMRQIDSKFGSSGPARDADWLTNAV